MTRDELVEKMLYWADRINEQPEYGALHIFVADGNCDDESLAFCSTLPSITAHERIFLNSIQEQLSEEARAGAWALAQCGGRHD